MLQLVNRRRLRVENADITQPTNSTRASLPAFKYLVYKSRRLVNQLDYKQMVDINFNLNSKSNEMQQIYTLTSTSTAAQMQHRFQHQILGQPASDTTTTDTNTTNPTTFTTVRGGDVL